MKIVGIFAHPDDEVLGCGATFARFAAEGAEIQTVFLADGETARQAMYDADAMAERIAARQAAARRAAQVMGTREPIFLNLPDNRLDGMPLLDIVKSVEGALSGFEADHVFTHHSGDLNIDHRIAHQATLTAFRPLPHRRPVAIYAAEVLSSTEWSPGGRSAQFHPQRFVAVGAYFDRKREAMACYDAEMDAFPHPRSAEAITAQAQLRGAQSGLKMAEAFEIVREVVA